MIPFELLLALAILVSLTVYMLTGGADYGGGVWDLFAFGTSAEKQRKVISNAIAPIWEAHHVWLILVIVILFTAYSSAFSAITTSLHLPLDLLLIGVVLRGAAFIFRSYDSTKDEVQKRWSGIFAAASLFTPICLGIIVGTISSGRFVTSGQDYYSVYIQPWLSLFPVMVGLFALCLFAFLAAVYLTIETDEYELQEDFRIRAIVSAVVVAIVAFLVFFISGSDAPEIRQALIKSPWSVWLIGATSFVAILAIFALIMRKYKIACVCAISQAVFILWGWGLSQFPYLVRPTFTIYNSAVPLPTLRLLLIALLVGAIILLPSFCFLLYIFKGNK